VTLELSSLASTEGLNRFALGPVGPMELEAGLTAVAPDKFEMRILGAYIVENVDPETSDNVGQASMVWLNEGCGEGIGGCKASDVDYFDLTDPTAANAALNSQGLPVTPGTYRYVRLEFCQGSADVPNVRYTVGEEEFEETYGGCGETSAELAEPIELAEGDSITIRLSYDLTDGEVYYAEGSDSCPPEAPCLGGIELEPSIVE